MSGRQDAALYGSQDGCRHAKQVPRRGDDPAHVRRAARVACSAPVRRAAAAWQPYHSEIILGNRSKEVSMSFRSLVGLAAVHSWLSQSRLRQLLRFASELRVSAPAI